MKYAVRLRMLLFLSIGALSLLLWSGSTQAAPPTGDSKTFVFDSSTITNTDYDTPFTGVYYVAPNGASTPAAIDYYYRPGGTAENIDTNVVAGTTGTPPLGASSWQSTALPDNGDGKIEILIHPDEIFGGAYTLADVQELSWETNKPGAIGDQDWYVNVWLDASGDTNADATTSSNDVAFLSGEPYWTSNNGSYASNTWTQWVADDTAGGNFEVNFHEPGYACTTFGWAGPEMPSLDQLTGGPYTWQGVPEIGFGAFGCPGNNGTVNSTIDYASMPILGISIATGNPWADTFNGYLDNFRIELNDGGQTNRIVVDFEDAQLQNEPTIDKAFSPNNILAGGVSTLDFTLDNSNATPLSDVNFTDNLPAGVVVAGTPNVSNACGGTVTAVAGSGTISLAGGYLDESANCIVSVDVTAATAGTYNNTSDPVGTNTENTAFANGTDTASATLNVSNAPTPQTIVVDPTNDQGWLFDNPVYCTPGTTPASAPYDPCSVTGGGAPIAGDFELGTDTEAGQGFEVGPGTPPEGNGSYFAEIYDGGSKVIAARNDYNNASFSGLLGMSIATYLDPSSGDNSNWYVNLYVDQDGDGGYDCRLDGTVPTQAAGSWQTTDLYNESWSGCSFTGTLSAFTAANPNAQLVSGFNATGFPQIIINQGDTADNYEGYVGNFDAFRLSHVDQGDITWDFEPEPADLAVTKSVALTNDVAGNSTYDPGDTINYTVTVTNNGPSDTTNVEIADALPGDYAGCRWSATQGSYDGTTTVGNFVGDTSATQMMVRKEK